jgi:hypothetical protein
MKITIRINRNKLRAIADYCHKNISPRRYYLHNSIGGQNWQLSQNTLEVEVDEQHAIMIKLKYSE